MLVDRVTGRARLQCASCGAHALVEEEDYRELLANCDGVMRCEVCGVRAPFMSMPPPDAERVALTIH
jgi:hypothetical protein